MNPTNEQASEAAEVTTVVAKPAGDYRAPARFPVGEAVELMKRNISGGLRDGTGGWYVWGS